MKKQWSAITITVATATTALLVLFGLLGDTASGISTPALAASLSLTVTAVDPAVAPNDLDTPIIITGTGFTAELSGTLVITPPTAYLGNTTMKDVTWVNSSTLSATVPWGIVREVHSLTVVNPDGISATLSSALTVTNGIGVWTTGGPYGGNVSQVLVSPFTPTIVYAVADGVALFASYDSAEHWERILEGK
ncbi:MAG: IPT/TIG domain-containing protein, partial [Anaerolineales bacterium]